MRTWPGYENLAALWEWTWRQTMARVCVVLFVALDFMELLIAFSFFYRAFSLIFECNLSIS